MFHFKAENGTKQFVLPFLFRLMLLADFYILFSSRTLIVIFMFLYVSTKAYQPYFIHLPASLVKHFMSFSTLLNN